jgi:heat shock protein HspQ
MNRANVRTAKFALGEIVRHRFHPFRGVVFDVDPVFANTEEWYQAIPADRRPSKDQPFYHLLAMNAQGPYEAYVSEQNLVADAENGPVAHPQLGSLFEKFEKDRYVPLPGRQQ